MGTSPSGTSPSGTSPSVLIMVDGDPVWENMDKSGYERVLNTPLFIVRDPKKGEHCIHGAESWYRSDDFTRRSVDRQHGGP